MNLWELLTDQDMLSQNIYLLEKLEHLRHRTITKEERELKLKQKDLPYKRRDHALFIAFAPYKNPRYAISIVIEHGGTGSSTAAPIAKKVIKKVLDRQQLRKNINQNLFQEV